MISNRLILFAVMLLFPASAWANSGIVVAVASSVFAPTRQVASAFEERYQTSVKLVSGSTGMLYSQIMHGAPYAVFMAADAETPKRLRGKLGLPPSAVETYVTGRLYMCVKTGAPDLHHLSGKIVMADPRLAPYGAAAKEALTHISAWPLTGTSVIYVPNVMMAAAYFERGLVGTAFVASSAITPNLRAKCAPVEPSLYTPIRQKALLLTTSPMAHAWLTFIRGPEASSVWKRAGFLAGHE